MVGVEMEIIKTCFTISAPDLSFSDITNSLGISPTNIRKKKDWPQPSIIAGIAEDAWTLSMENEQFSCVSQSIQKLCQLLLPKAPIVRRLCDRYHATTHIEIIIHTEENSLPEMVLPAEQISFLSELHAELGFDIYFDL